MTGTEVTAARTRRSVMRQQAAMHYDSVASLVAKFEYITASCIQGAEHLSLQIVAECNKLPTRIQEKT